MVLEVQPYLIISVWPHLEIFCPFRPFGAIFGLGLGPKKIFQTYKCRLSILLLELQSYLLFSFGPIWGFFGPFWALWGNFWIGIRSKNYFGTYLHSLTTFVLEVCGFYSSFILFWVAGWLAGLVENIATSAPN